MGYETKKTEHSGPKKGSGSYWGYKRDAKRGSNKKRRNDGRILAEQGNAERLENDNKMEVK